MAYLDIKAAFDSVDRQALWKALRSRGVLTLLLDLIVALHEGTGVQCTRAPRLESIPAPTDDIWCETALCLSTCPLLRHHRLDPEAYEAETWVLVSKSAVNNSVIWYTPMTRPSLSTQHRHLAVSSLYSFKDTAAALDLRPKMKLQNLTADNQPSSIAVDGNVVD